MELSTVLIKSRKRLERLFHQPRCSRRSVAGVRSHIHGDRPTPAVAAEADSRRHRALFPFSGDAIDIHRFGLDIPRYWIPEGEFARGDRDHGDRVRIRLIAVAAGHLSDLHSDNFFPEQSADVLFRQDNAGSRSDGFTRDDGRRRTTGPALRAILPGAASSAHHCCSDCDCSHKLLAVAHSTRSYHCSYETRRPQPSGSRHRDLIGRRQ